MTGPCTGITQPLTLCLFVGAACLNTECFLPIYPSFVCQELSGRDPYSMEKSYNFSVPQIMSEQIDEVDCIIFFEIALTSFQKQMFVTKRDSSKLHHYENIHYSYQLNVFYIPIY